MPPLGLKNTAKDKNSKEVCYVPTSKNALIIFTRNPELGSCKTRLAATVGDKAALDIYSFLLHHTVDITRPLQADKFVYYSVKKRDNDIWDAAHYRKKVQQGDDLGIRMQHAFEDVFNLGYKNVIIIGSDMYDMNTRDIQTAFTALETRDAVIGPAEDGGYYLLGMKTVNKAAFKNKTWGTNTVLAATLKDFEHENIAVLTAKNDVDYFEDIQNIDIFQQFFPTELKTKNN